MSSNPDTDVYNVGKNLLVAHSLAYKTYNDNYKTSQGGLVSCSYLCCFKIKKLRFHSSCNFI